MKIDALVVLVAIGLTSCSEPEVSNVEYNRGWQRAEVEGCHCNPALPASDAAEIDRQSKGWAEGYVEACIRFRQERSC
ncbi:MAG: hypothetical protein ACRERU_08485 [Methylococcales bacterium]